ncbi:sulfate/molybdate ABC transporter ATP-binding protein [Flavisphingomonas formosensis]|uniref:sulfate/molybdate ABC transporter ATP-binding protein n=1 Tax=Flavisphingomonas formosensis TaxID=861534 RepID=UPI0012FC9998|nr:sulfate/molybdate ABC transporter ATP-binding protein [Sphingomonas formosensis]
MSITLSGITKRFGDFTALDNVSLEARPGEFLALLGPSGSGKTTLLRIMAGLDFPDTGSVSFNGSDITDRPVADRAVGFVFQHYALFRHMTVAGNVGFGLSVKPRRERPTKEEIRRRVDDLLELVQLKHLGGRYPSQLSGGQRQRVALARALAVEPRILLLDEPFGALDAKVRKDLRRWLRELHERMGLTSIFVTHDQEEALELADRVVVMDHGKIEQVAVPVDVYDKPASAFVFDFVGESNRLPVTVGNGRIVFDNVAIEGAAPDIAEGAGQLFFRPHDARLTQEGAGVPATVSSARPRNGAVRIEAQVAGLELPLELDIPSDQAPSTGSAIFVQPTRAKLFPAGQTIASDQV